MKNILFFIVTFSLFTSCEKAFLGEAESNDPVNNFEIFWNDFDQHYALFDVRGWDWDSIYTVYRPQITEQTTDAELWMACRSMIQYLDDSHTFLFSPDEEYMILGDGENFYTSGGDLDYIYEQEFSLPLIKDKYIENFKDFSESEDDVYFSAKVKGKNIGYIYFNDIGTGNYGLIDNLLQETENYEAIIIDIRHNGGGNDLTAEAFAARFSDNEELVYTVEEKIGPARNDFSDKILYHSPKKDGNHYDGYVIVLTDNFTVSGAEIFLWYMKTYDKVTHIGDYTSGDYSDTSMRRFLPNGWQYQYSIMKFLTSDGKSLDGIGHEPEVYARNSNVTIQAGDDVVMERALSYLLEEYGIE